MKSLGRETEPRPFAHVAGVTLPGGADEPRPLAPARWDWSRVRSVLLVRLRSIGDTVLATPSIHALRRFLPEARIDVMLEDWVAPLLEGSDEIDRVIRLERDKPLAKLAAWRAMKTEAYDVAYNLHGGNTASLFTWASGARERVGYANYRTARLQNHDAPHPYGLWGREGTHSAEQQLGLLGWTGVPVTDRPASRLPVTAEAAERADRRLRKVGLGAPSRPFALIHPVAAFDTKTWAADNFARVAEHLGARGIPSVAVVGPKEARVAAELVREARVPVASFDDLSLPELSALAARASLFVGNDSGVAHIAAAHGVPQVVVFGSSNVAHWRPWTSAPAEVVREEMPCAPCPGYTCAEFDAPECIRRVPVARVVAAVERVLKASLESGV
jgi:heptosyltransferase-3